MGSQKRKWTTTTMSRLRPEELSPTCCGTMVGRKTTRMFLLSSMQSLTEEVPEARPKPVPLKDVKPKKDLSDVGSRCFSIGGGGGNTETVMINNKISPTQPVVDKKPVSATR